MKGTLISTPSFLNLMVTQIFFLIILYINDVIMGMEGISKDDMLTGGRGGRGGRKMMA